MKKTRIIVAVVAAALMIMGVGYAALWSNSIQTTVNGSYGNIDVQLTNAPAGTYWDGSQFVVQSTKKLYPGATDELAFTITNRGSVAAKLTGFTVGNLYNTSHLLFRFSEQPASAAAHLTTGYTLTESVIKSLNDGQPVVLQPGVPVPYTFNISVASDAPVNEDLPSDYHFTVTTDFQVVPYEAPH